MKPTINLETFDTPVQLDRQWAKGRAPDEATLLLKEALRAHLEAQDADLRAKAACAAIVTLMITLGPDEGPLEDLLPSLREAASNWVRTWCGSEPLAVRVGPVLARHLPNRVDRDHSVPAGVACEVVVAPVRPQHHRGRVTGRVVSINKALSELALATLGTDSATRHAAALLASWRAHLAAALPGLVLAERAPLARDLIRDVEDLQERVAALDQARMRHAEREAELSAFPGHVQAVLSLIEERVIYLTDQGDPAAKRGTDVPKDVSDHVRRHKASYRQVLNNPTFSSGMRHMLAMTLSEVERLCGTSAKDNAMPSETAGDGTWSKPLVSLLGAQEAS